MPELDPHYRPCVGIMVINRDGLVWIGRRKDERRPAGDAGWWQMPQGGIDAGEQPVEAALRELREETGIQSVEMLGETPGWLRYDLPAELIGKTWGGRYRGQQQKWFAVRIAGADSEIHIGPGADGHCEFDAWRWVPVQDVPRLIVAFKRDVYREVVRAFAALARPSR
jgi:putative (di)nucleoside polyphosphate hydrolase